MSAAIALESTPWLGADHTSSVLRPIYEAIFGRVPDARWDVIHHFIRKSGHFIGYGLVGLSWLRAWRKIRPGWKFVTAEGLALLAVALTASADEFHQSFLPNRTASPWDVLLDCCGAATLLILFYVIIRVKRQQRRARPA